MKSIFLSLLAAVALLAPFGATNAADGDPKLVRIGYQKSSTLMAVLRAQGKLEKSLAAEGYSVQWSEFTSGLPLTEALNVGGIDLSADVADTVPLFAQAAGANLTYFAQEAASPSAQAILVKADSPLKSVADLKGHKVAVAKAAGAHYLLLAALAKAGLKFSDIQPAYLSPADGRAAFEQGSVDAWAVWDPYVSAAQRQSSARTLVDGSGLANYRRYYLASTPFTKAEPKAVNAVYKALAESGLWVKANPDAAATLLAPIWGLDEATVKQANARRSYQIGPVVADSLVDQQKIADAFFSESLLPKAVDAKAAAIWQPAVLR